DVGPVEDDGPFVGAQGAGHAVDQRGLARAVGPDEAEPLAGLHVERHPVEGREAAEPLDHGVHLQEWVRHGPQRPRSRRTRPTRPSGASTTKATSTTPTMRRFSSEEMVTVATWEAVPSRTAPTTGPTQLVVPPLIGTARGITTEVRGLAGVAGEHDRAPPGGA